MNFFKNNNNNISLYKRTLYLIIYPLPDVTFLNEETKKKNQNPLHLCY